MSHTLLIVDDSKLARMAAVRALGNRYPDWSRVEAASGSEALEAVEQQSPDIALVDFNMPGQDGLDLVAALRRLKPSMPIAVISANSQQEIVDRTRALDATFLGKPLSEDAFGEFLDDAAQALEQQAGD